MSDSMNEYSPSAPVAELLRSLPQRPHHEVMRYGRMIIDGSFELECRNFRKSTQSRHGRGPVYYRRGVPGIIDRLVLADLRVAIPKRAELTPPEALSLVDECQKLAVQFAGHADRDPAKFQKAALGFVGLHNTLLSDNSDEAGIVNLAAATNDYAAKFIAPTYRARAISYR